MENGKVVFKIFSILHFQFSIETIDETKLHISTSDAKFLWRYKH